MTDYKKAFERITRANLWSAVGVGMVLISYGGVFSKCSFPGWCAAFPTIGVGLLLATTSQSTSAVGKLLRSRFLVSIGKMSYSLYLWHWPVFLGVERWMKGPIHPTLAPDWATPVVSLALSFALAGVCYKWVESPLRGWRWTPVLSGFVALALIIGMGSVKEARLTAKYVAKRDQTFVTERSNEWVGNHRGNKATDLSAGTEIKVTAGLGRLNQGVVRKYGSDRIDVMVVGDSHGEALESMFDHLLQSQKLTGVFFCYPGQPPDSIITGERNRSRFVPEAIRSFRAEQKMVLDSDFPRVVVYVTRYEARKYGDYPLSLRYVLDRAPCIFLQQPPVLNVENISLADQLSVYLSRGRSLDKLDIREKPESTLKRRRFEKSLFSEFGGSPGFIFLKTDDVFCQPSGQARWWDGTSRLYYRDDDHLSPGGASLLEERMLAAINAALKKTL